MKTIYSVSKLLMLLLGMAFTVTSCLRPDLDDCPRQNVRIVVKTHTEASRAESNTHTIENVTIYVFDQQNKFVTAWQGSAYVYGSTYVAEMNIDPGLYHFVIWTNQGETYTTTHSIEECHTQAPSLHELTLYMACPADNVITTDLPDLHHGKLSDAQVHDNTINEFTVVLRPNTYKINFTVKGITNDDSDYALNIRDNNSHYTFDNRIIDGQDDFDHLREGRFTNGELKASMNVLRLASDRSPWFSFTNLTTDDCLFENCLVEMITKAYSTGGRTVDFDETFEFDITLTFTGNLGVIVSVNGWSYTGSLTDL